MPAEGIGRVTAAAKAPSNGAGPSSEPSAAADGLTAPLPLLTRYSLRLMTFVVDAVPGVAWQGTQACPNGPLVWILLAGQYRGFGKLESDFREAARSAAASVIGEGAGPDAWRCARLVALVGEELGGLS